MSVMSWIHSVGIPIKEHELSLLSNSNALALNVMPCLIGKHQKFGTVYHAINFPK